MLFMYIENVMWNIREKILSVVLSIALLSLWGAYLYSTSYCSIFSQTEISWNQQLLSCKELESLRTNSPDLSDMKNVIRIKFIKTLRENWYTQFVKTPFPDGKGNGWIEITKEWYMMKSIIVGQDDLDTYIEKLDLNKKSSQWIVFSMKELLDLQNIYLFKSQKDLEMLGYKVVSHRVRTADKEEYRRHNIKQAFDDLGGLRVINPGKVSFMKNIDLENRAAYKNGYAIIDNQTKEVYAWGICGASTAIYQWALTNKSLSFQWQAHSKRYTKLYAATINWEDIFTPWLDTTVYWNTIDFVVENKAKYPIILAMNFDWEEEWQEEVFTLWMEDDFGSFAYNRSFKSWDYSCYERIVNGEKERSCYKEVH